MCAAMGSPHDVSGAAHVDDKTALRLEGVAPSVEARLKGLRDCWRRSGASDGGARHARKPRLLARGARRGAARRATRDAVVWQHLLPADRGPGIVARIKAQRPSAEAFYDWSGGLVWLALPPSDDADHAIVRGALGATGRPCHLDPRAGNVRARRAGIPAAAGGARRAGSAREGKLRSQGPLQSGPDGLTMQTNFTLAQLADPETARSEHDPAQVRALRLLHRDLPDLRAAGRRARQPARAHLLHQGDAGGRSRADGVGGQARRPLPVVPVLHDDLSVGRELHASGRSRPASHRGDATRARCRIGCCAGCWPG